MVDVEQLTSQLIDRLRAEAANDDATWIDELERRRRELAAETDEIMARVKRAAVVG